MGKKKSVKLVTSEIKQFPVKLIDNGKISIFNLDEEIFKTEINLNIYRTRYTNILKQICHIKGLNERDGDMSVLNKLETNLSIVLEHLDNVRSSCQRFIAYYQSNKQPYDSNIFNHYIISISLSYFMLIGEDHDFYKLLKGTEYSYLYEDEPIGSIYEPQEQKKPCAREKVKRKESKIFKVNIDGNDYALKLPRRVRNLFLESVEKAEKVWTEKDIYYLNHPDKIGKSMPKNEKDNIQKYVQYLNKRLEKQDIPYKMKNLKGEKNIIRTLYKLRVIEE